jgi:hypothetical protein
MHIYEDKNMSRFVNQNLMQITEEILASYDMDPKTQRIGERFLPSRSAIMDILEEIRRLIFPGLFGHKLLTPENIR